jgi:hypothetical protein
LCPELQLIVDRPTPSRAQQFISNRSMNGPSHDERRRKIDGLVRD